MSRVLFARAFSLVVGFLAGLVVLGVVTAAAADRGGLGPAAALVGLLAATAVFVAVSFGFELALRRRGRGGGRTTPPGDPG